MYRDTISPKLRARSSEIQTQVEQFLAAGGSIQECPPCTMKKTEGPKRESPEQLRRRQNLTISHRYTL